MATINHDFPTTRGDAKFEPAHQYQCTAGHWIDSTRPVEVCPLTPLGEPCPGTLRPARTEKVSA